MWRMPDPRVQWAVRVIELVLEVVGAVLILVAFALAQFRGLDRHGSLYLVAQSGGCGSPRRLGRDPSPVGILAVARRLGARRVVGTCSVSSAGASRPRERGPDRPDRRRVLILAGFILSQRNLLDADSYLYLILNLAGAAILAVLAFQAQRWGFVLLEGVWALVALAGLILRLAGKETRAGTH